MSSTATHAPPSPSTRRPYHGSCHCGRIRYIVFISMPPASLGRPSVQHTPSVRFYKCNCSTCHKMGIFHIRVPDSPHDFFLLSPLELSELSEYRCANMMIRWYFCGNCGVRCFAFRGEGEVVGLDLEKALGRDGAARGEITKVWRCKEEGWEEGRGCYLSVNAHTIEPGQEGLDLRELVDKKWIAYLDCKDFIKEDRFDYPQEGGTW